MSDFRTSQIHGGFFPIIGHETARNTLVNVRWSVATTSERGFTDSEIELAKAKFTVGWRRRLRELDLLELHDLPTDPFAEIGDNLSKTREEKIADMAAELQRFRTIYENGNQHELAAYPETYDGDRVLAKRLLDAAERETPEWPTKKSLLAYNHARNAPALGSHEDGIRAAMLADPIIKAAIEWRRGYSELGATSDLGARQRLAAAVKASGL